MQIYTFLRLFGAMIGGVYTLSLLILLTNQFKTDISCFKTMQNIFGILLLASPIAFVVTIVSCIVSIKTKTTSPRARLIFVGCAIVATIITGYFLFMFVCLWKVGSINPG